MASINKNFSHQKKIIKHKLIVLMLIYIKEQITSIYKNKFGYIFSCFAVIRISLLTFPFYTAIPGLLILINSHITLPTLRLPFCLVYISTIFQDFGINSLPLTFPYLLIHFVLSLRNLFASIF